MRVLLQITHSGGEEEGSAIEAAFFVAVPSYFGGSIIARIIGFSNCFGAGIPAKVGLAVFGLFLR
jgi:hypothetical protein